MPIIIALYFLAGGLAAAGLGGGAYVFDVARREAARDLQRRDREALVDALKEEIDLADLRARAAAAGVDPDTVELGYVAFRDGRISFEQLLQSIQMATS
jgi:hypothetical protein